MIKVTLHKHEAVPKCGSFEVRFDIPGRRLKPGQMDRATALAAAKALAKAERDKPSGGL